MAVFKGRQLNKIFFPVLVSQSVYGLFFPLETAGLTAC